MGLELSATVIAVVVVVVVVVAVVGESDVALLLGTSTVADVPVAAGVALPHAESTAAAIVVMSAVWMSRDFMTSSLRRHDPNRFDGRRHRSAALSARY